MTNENEETNHGLIKTPGQTLLAASLGFLAPVFVILGLVYFYSSAPKQAPGGDNSAQSVDQRIQKVGTLEVKDSSQSAAHSGEEVYKAQCAACHASGAAGAPKFGDAGAWAPRIKQGLEALEHSALKGKGAMPPQAGGQFDDTEIARAVVYMANAAGAKFEEPAAADDKAAGAGESANAAPAAAQKPTAGESSASAAATPEQPAAGESSATPAAAPAAAAPAASASAGADDAHAAAGKKIYETTCAACHGTGVAGAPKFGDKAAWAPRLAAGFDEVLKIATHGKGAMPPKGGSNASDADFKAAVEYLVNSAR
ncbi:cytochrome c5 family protein [Comamonas sp. NLF-1-9]|uniref:c-type cytochrome n=1 Tax=Comamonas sp. NLF-1-9 TaxID=2853163 RepID=UPI001C4657CC|nr:c-type cytochrome [Comamonas sp. NLF-1-9]QXL84337.1 c-type cytochrome [Comamonas sp. NLF-1-9]